VTQVSTSTVHWAKNTHNQQQKPKLVTARDCNPGLVFSISGFGFGDFVVPESHMVILGSHQDYGISPTI